MKHHQLLLIYVISALIILPSCKLMWPIRMDYTDFSKIENTIVNSLVLKKGDTVRFGKDKGRYIKTIIKDTVYTGIIGYDTTETKAMNFPMYEIASVQGDLKEVSVPFTIFVSLISALLLIGISFSIYLNGGRL